MALTKKLEKLADAIRVKTNSAEKMTLEEMAAKVEGIVPPPPEEAFVLTHDCEKLFYGDRLRWYIDTYGDRVTTKDIYNAKAMFYSTKVERIPFDINLLPNSTVNTQSLFSCNYYLREAPRVYGKVAETGAMFINCYRLTYIPEDFGDNIEWSYHSTSYGDMTDMFGDCVSLRHIPTSILKNMWQVNPNYDFYSPYYRAFSNCAVLEEIDGLGVCKYLTKDSSFFWSTFGYCTRLKKITFATQEDGSPYTANWRNQTLHLNGYIGYEKDTGPGSQPTRYQVLAFPEVHGITLDTLVTDDESYQALKNNPDWWTTDVAYSRYNHDSAVETINSLPDTSEYLAANGGTNTIRFEGAAGSKTDGGAINTLTEEEIAVATAKGWTVTLV